MFSKIFDGDIDMQKTIRSSSMQDTIDFITSKVDQYMVCLAEKGMIDIIYKENEYRSQESFNNMT